MHGDEFSGTYCVFPDSIYKTDPVTRKDKAERKRVELHLHTKMSAMDGFIDAGEAVKTAAKWGRCDNGPRRGAGIPGRGERGGQAEEKRR